jgi:hypothetical protein
MRRADGELSPAEQLRALGYGPLLGLIAGLCAAPLEYLFGAPLRAVFWLLVALGSGLSLFMNWIVIDRERNGNDLRLVAFGRDHVLQKRAAAQNAWATAMELSEQIQERFAGRHDLAPDKFAEFTRLERQYTEKKAHAEWLAWHCDLMIQANARVANGSELLTEARKRVDAVVAEAMHADTLRWAAELRNAASEERVE